MHSDPYDFDNVPVGGGNRPRREYTPPAGGVAAAAPKRQLIAEKLYKQQHVDEPSPRGGNAARKRGGLGGPASRPQLLMCYLCGQQFGTSSLHIHQPQCYVKKLLQWEKSPLANRGPKPLSPEEFAAQAGHGDQPIHTGDAQAIEAFNNAQYKNYTEKMLIPCENCGRTFLPDRLVVHQRSCKPGSTARRIGSASPARAAAATASSSANAGAKPTNVSSSSPTMDDVPVRSSGGPTTGAPPRDRSPSPRMSEELGPSRPRTAGAPSRLGRPSLRDLDDVPSVPSPDGTGSTRTPPSASSPSSPPTSRSAKSFGGPARTNDLVPCQYCKRTFATHRIEKHEGVCIERNAGGSAAPAPKTAAKKSFPAVPSKAGGRVVSSSPARNVPARVDSGLRPRSPHTGARPSTSGGGVSGGSFGGNATPRSLGAGRMQAVRQSPPPKARPNPPTFADLDGYPTPPRSTSPSMAQIHASLDELSREVEASRAGNDATRTPRRSGVSPGMTPSATPPPPQHGASFSGAASCNSSVAERGPTPVRPLLLPDPSNHASTGGRSSSVQSVGSANPRPKFCCECGTRVPSSTAKFCCECGSRL